MLTWQIGVPLVGSAIRLSNLWVLHFWVKYLWGIFVNSWLSGLFPFLSFPQTPLHRSTRHSHCFRYCKYPGESVHSVDANIYLIKTWTPTGFGTWNQTPCLRGWGGVAICWTGCRWWGSGFDIPPPQNPHKNARRGSAGRWNRRPLGSQWPASLAVFVGFRPVKDPLSN